MAQLTATSEFAAEPRVGRGFWSDAAHRIGRDRLAMACLAVIVVYAVMAVAAPWMFSTWKDSYNYDNVNSAPSWRYWLGTDVFGRSILQKTLLAASTSMTVGFMANIIAVPLGMVLGAVAGFYGRRIDDLIVWLYTTLASIPGIIRLIALKVAFAGIVLFEGVNLLENTPLEFSLEIDLGGIVGLYIALGVMSWVGTCRLVRAETMKLRESDYALAARAVGRGDLAILFRHIVPNLLHLGIIQFSLGFVGAIQSEVILSYLGIGVQDRPSWGKMIDAARMDLVVGRWWEITAAVGAMFLIVLAWNIFGDRLRDALDPRLKNV